MRYCASSKFRSKTQKFWDLFMCKNIIINPPKLRYLTVRIAYWYGIEFYHISRFPGLSIQYRYWRKQPGGRHPQNPFVRLRESCFAEWKANLSPEWRDVTLVEIRNEYRCGYNYFVDSSLRFKVASNIFISMKARVVFHGGRLDPCNLDNWDYSVTWVVCFPLFFADMVWILGVTLI